MSKKKYFSPILYIFCHYLIQPDQTLTTKKLDCFMNILLKIQSVFNIYIPQVFFLQVRNHAIASWLVVLIQDLHTRKIQKLKLNED